MVTIPYSSAALRLAQRSGWRDKTIVCVFADSGQRYLSVEGLFSAGD